MGRWGGEEFIIILPNTPASQAFKKMEKLRKNIEKFIFPDVEQVTVSFGLAMARENDSSDNIMQRADECLYKAKEQGRNCVVIKDK